MNNPDNENRLPRRALLIGGALSIPVVGEVLRRTGIIATGESKPEVISPENPATPDKETVPGTIYFNPIPPDRL